VGELLTKQIVFTQGLAKLLVWIYNQPGYSCVVKEVVRTKAQAVVNALSGKGIVNSLHLDGLAADIAIFRIENGTAIYLTDSKEYKFAGEYWKSLNPLFKWGGDFSKPDGNHFSMAHGGRQ
jgi:hypothetical protein